MSCAFGDKIKSGISEYKADSNIGYDSLLLISTIHYFILLLLYMAFDDSWGPTLTQWLIERKVERDENYVCFITIQIY